jgi:hypothetical protein
MDHAQRVRTAGGEPESAGGASPSPGTLLAGRWRVAGAAGRVPGGWLVNALDERLRRRVRVLVADLPGAVDAGPAHPLIPAPLATEDADGRALVAYPFWEGDLLALPHRPLADDRELRALVARATAVLELLDQRHRATGRAHGHLSLSSFWRAPDGRWWMLDASTRGAPDPRFAHPDDDPADPRSDLYAFAAVLYAVATGALPFGAGDGAAVAHRLLRPPESPALPGPIAEVLRTALQRSPHHRFSSARRMIAAFQQAMDALDGLAPDPREAPERVPVGGRSGPEPTLEPPPVRARAALRREADGWSLVFVAGLSALSLAAWAGLAGLVVALGKVF